MIKSHAVELHFEKLFHRKLAPGVPKTHDNPVDGSRAHDCRDVFDGSDNSRVEHWQTDPGRIWIDEPDDIYAERLTALKQLLRQRHGRRTCADEKKALPGSNLLRQPIEYDPPTDDQESALVETLAAGGAAYTAIVRGVNDTTGIALVEIYALTN